MNKKEIFTHFSRIIDSLIERNDFYKFYLQAPFSLENPIEEDGVSVICGASRGCILEKGYDWVVKFDLADSGDELATCEKEEKIYCAAMREKLQDFFAEPTYIGTYTASFDFFNSCDFSCYDTSSFYDELTRLNKEYEAVPMTIEIPLYAYPHANSYSFSKVLFPEQTRSELGVSPLTEKNLAVGYAFSCEYDTDEYERLVSFLEEYGVNDLHCANVGEIAGKPVLVDYCGYNAEGYY